MTELTLNEQFVVACKDNNIEKVKDLFTNPVYNNQVNIHYLEDSGFLQACKQGHIELVEYLLTSPDLKEHADIHAQSDYALILAAEKEHIDIIHFLLHSPKLKNHIDLFANFVEIDKVLDNLLADMHDQGYAADHNYEYPLLQYIVCEAGLEKNTNPELEELITDLVEYNDEFYEVYKKNKQIYDSEKKKKLKMF